VLTCDRLAAVRGREWARPEDLRIGEFGGTGGGADGNVTPLLSSAVVAAVPWLRPNRLERE
jgi:hypothetical protein